jgi:hypothetical protein
MESAASHGDHLADVDMKSDSRKEDAVEAVRISLDPSTGRTT